MTTTAAPLLKAGEWRKWQELGSGLMESVLQLRRQNLPKELVKGQGSGSSARQRRSLVMQRPGQQCCHCLSVCSSGYVQHGWMDCLLRPELSKQRPVAPAALQARAPAQQCARVSSNGPLGALACKCQPVTWSLGAFVRALICCTTGAATTTHLVFAALPIIFRAESFHPAIPSHAAAACLLRAAFQ